MCDFLPAVKESRRNLRNVDSRKPQREMAKIASLASQLQIFARLIDVGGPLIAC